MSEVRLKKVESLLQAEISSLITRGVVKDPRVPRMTTVTGVEVSGDLHHAKVFISFFGSEEERTACVEALNHAAGFIHRKLGESLHMRTVPRPAFYGDKSIERGVRITRKLRELFP
ncbi:MAG: 30S ribosome-binding factor RbfA [Spirochaetales bacterium]|nr:30S ribosome-binding factor RbfA [Spirochaetales bacterium]